MDENKVTKKIIEKRKKKNTKMPMCEVCKKNVALGVFCVPSVPISCAYCIECYNANAHPWWILVSNTACCSGLDKTADWWKWMVTDTCEHLGKSIDEFLFDVELSIIKLDAYNAERFEKEKKKYRQKLFDDCKFKGTFANCKPECCVACHDNGKMHIYKEHANCDE